MGEVYRARDTRLERTVAVKILPSHLSENLEAKQRFDREARAISHLNHSNICTLYDVGHQGGVDYLVMEFLEGETLSERLRKSPSLPSNCGKFFQMNLADTPAPLFDVTAGQRFLAMTPARAEASSISLLLHWPTLLEK